MDKKELINQSERCHELKRACVMVHTVSMVIIWLSKFSQ
jgi:hypothetical protein